MKFSLLIIVFMFSLQLNAQNEWWNKNSTKHQKKTSLSSAKKVKKGNSITRSPSIIEDTTQQVFVPGKVEINKSSLVDAIIKFKAATIPPYTAPTMDGYRIQLFFDQSKRLVDSARAQILGMDPDAITYVKYMAPNYYLFEGDYRAKLDAEKNRAKWLSNFPTAIVKETRIYLPQISNKPEKAKDTDGD